MKLLDKALRAWRTRIALKAVSLPVRAVLDIGCGDHYLLARLQAERRHGIDPELHASYGKDGIQLFSGRFPSDLKLSPSSERYDVIFALAVFEHLSEEDFALVRDLIPELLSERGRLIVTVPHPFVDEILGVLIRFRLIDGQAVHEHHGFDPERMREIASNRLRLLSRKRFQLGLNNLFVFERT